MNKTFLSSALLAYSLAAAAQTVSSPDGNVVVAFSLDGSRPQYAVTYKGRDVILPSHLGLELARDKHASRGLDETDLMDGFTVAGVKLDTFDETWQPVWGETRDIRNHYNEMAVTLAQTGGRTMVVRFRVFDDGVGFRYEFPQQKDLVYFLIQDERTEFRMTGDHTAWWLPGDYDTQEQMTQESRLSEIRSRFHDAVNWGNSSVAVFSPTGVQTSLQMRTADGLYINLHELRASIMPPCTSNLSMPRPRPSPPSSKARATPTPRHPHPRASPCLRP